MIQFIEVTKGNGEVLSVGLRFIKLIRADSDGGAVLVLDDNSLPLKCKQSYQQVRSALGATVG